MSAAAAGPAPVTADHFRSDINGLRALAIALVVAFHLARGAAPGGFVGVDVFFVISGYLMTKIILGRLDEGRFGLIAFYLARLRRIWPALVMLCAGLALAGAVGLDPWTYERTMRDALAAMAFVSNLVFAGRNGYFGQREEANWLLHTWSLSVEWQFYILFPLFLIGLCALPRMRRFVWLAIALAAAASLALALHAWAQASTASFYQLQTRAWELLAGALALGLERWWRPGERARLAFQGLGLAGIAAGAVLATPIAGWPSPLALAPVGGAALMLAAPPRRTYWAENPVVGLVGRASYSIYLWHWPLIVAARYAGLAGQAWAAAAEIAAMLGLGLASYWLVERRLTAWVFERRWTHWLAGLGVAAATGALAFAAVRAQGFEAVRTATLPAATRASLADDRAASRDWTYPASCGARTRIGPVAVCSFGDPAARDVAVIGDSHAEQVAPRYARAFHPGDGHGASFVTHDGCMPVPGVQRADLGQACGAWSTAAYRWIAEAGFRRVVIISSWTIYVEPQPFQRRPLTVLGHGPPLSPAAAFDRLAAEIRTLQAAGVQVTLVGPSPRGDDADPASHYRRTFWAGAPAPAGIARADYEAQARVSEAELRRISALTGAPLVDPLDSLCPGGACPFVDGGRALYMNPGHFRASAVTAPRFAYLDPLIAPSLAPVSSLTVNPNR